MHITMLLTHATASLCLYFKQRIVPIDNHRVPIDNHRVPTGNHIVPTGNHIVPIGDLQYFQLSTACIYCNNTSIIGIDTRNYTSHFLFIIAI